MSGTSKTRKSPTQHWKIARDRGLTITSVKNSLKTLAEVLGSFDKEIADGQPATAYRIAKFTARLEQELTTINNALNKE